MKIKLILLLLSLLGGGVVGVCLLVDGRRRQADLNMLSGVATSFFDRDYPQLQIVEKSVTVPFPVDKCSDLFVRKIITANFPEPIVMLNLPYASYVEICKVYSPDPRGTPLVWARRTSFGREYYVYWGANNNGIMTGSELNKFIDQQAAKRDVILNK